MFSFKSPLWRERDFLRLWAAQSVSDFGARITREGLPIMAVVVLAAAPAELGVLAALSSAAGLLVGLTAGDYVDHTPRRRILIWTDALRAAVLLSVPLAAWLGLLSIWQVYVVAAMVAAASVLFAIADHAYLPSLVGKPLVLDANAKISATESVAEMGGPALAGVLFQVLTAPFALAVNAATYVVSALFLARIRTPEAVPDAGRRRGWRSGLVTGAVTSWQEARVRVLLVMTATGGLFGGFFSALYIAYVLRDLGLGTALMGLGIAAGGVGAMIGSVLAQPMARWLGVGPAISITGALSALGTMLILLAPADRNGAFAALVISQILGDAFGVIPLILAASLRQSVLPNSLLGRAGATFRAVSGGGAVIGALAGGVLGGVFGIRATLFAAIAGLLIGPAYGLAAPALRRVREMPLGSDDPAGG
ncbi:MAG: MFS transporter [Phenylobacterium sp.]|uniref:MFS transporter n=1 Tax=Phenylobacterium sp. TaxID=1871053 RepID=UPI001A568FEF|nr:MFS transporter [Phenylobacterium sp.]MBL8554272.1 MFS transporter [Phenylobacterium sp.]